MPQRKRVLVLSQAAVGADMAGTGIRALELAHVLAATCDVTVAAVGEGSATVRGLPVVGYHPQDAGTLAPALAGVEVVVATPGWPAVMGALRRSRARLVFDLYVPEALETVGGYPGSRDAVRSAFTALATDRFVDALHAGSAFICASERQRDLILGAMVAERLIAPARVDADPALRGLVDVVPFGLPAAPAVAAADGPREAFGGRVPADGEIVIWNGGLWPWLDAATSIRAVAQLRDRRPGVTLVFMGAAPQVPAQRAMEDAKSVARELGVLDTAVLFNDRWVPYERRADWLQAAACAVSTHADHLETRFAFRTRLLDCFWARLPVVCTGGDDLADVIDRRGGGAVVAAGDVAGTADALERVLGRGRAAFGPALDAIAHDYEWPRAAAPLVRMVAADLPAAKRHVPGLAHGARRAGYTVARSALNAIGRRDWPRL